MKANLFLLACIALIVFSAIRGTDFESEGPAPIIGATVLVCCIVGGILRYNSQRP